MASEDHVTWYGSGPLWDEFVQWSNHACSPGQGSGHLVPWYWDIWRAAAAAKDRMYDRGVR